MKKLYGKILWSEAEREENAKAFEIEGGFQRSPVIKCKCNTIYLKPKASTFSAVVVRTCQRFLDSCETTKFTSQKRPSKMFVKKVLNNKIVAYILNIILFNFVLTAVEVVVDIYRRYTVIHSFNFLQDESNLFVS